MKIEIHRILRFLLFGLLAVGIDYLTMTATMSTNIDQIIAKILGYVAALGFTILLVGRFVFQEKSRVKPVFVGSLYLISGTANVLLFAFLRNDGLQTELAFLAATGLSAFLNYSALRFLISR